MCYWKYGSGPQLIANMAGYARIATAGSGLAYVDVADPTFFAAFEAELEPLGIAVRIRVLRRFPVIQVLKFRTGCDAVDNDIEVDTGTTPQADGFEGDDLVVRLEIAVVFVDRRDLRAVGLGRFGRVRLLRRLIAGRFL